MIEACAFCLFVALLLVSADDFGEFDLEEVKGREKKGLNMRFSPIVVKPTAWKRMKMGRLTGPVRGVRIGIFDILTGVSFVLRA